jgi:rhodanese-related sulfurtransferase
MRVVATLILLSLAWPASAEVLTPNAAETRAEAGQLTIIDVRLPQEWAETGLPAGAVGISLQNPKTLRARPDFVNDVLHVLGGQRNTPVAVICAGGTRSAIAAEQLAEAGFTKVYDISEGVSGGVHGPGWMQRHLPTEPCKTC